MMYIFCSILRQDRFNYTIFVLSRLLIKLGKAFIMNQYPDFDQKLYDDLRRGKEYAFAAVFERYNRLLYTIAYRFLKSEEEAEDAIQYLFMKLWEQRTNFSF